MHLSYSSKKAANIFNSSYGQAIIFLELNTLLYYSANLFEVIFL